MRRKNTLEYIVLALFIMCMALALSAALEYPSLAKERPYMLQGIALLELVALTLVVFVSIRLVNKAAPHISERHRDWIALILCAVCILGGIVVRVIVIEKIPMQPESDFRTYFRIAGELANDAMLTPEADFDREYIAMYPHTIGFPMLILAPLFRIFGESIKVALYANLVCSTISLVLSAHIGWKLVGRLGAVLVALLMSFWPSHVFFSNMVATEQSFTMLLLVAVELIIVVLRRDGKSMYATKPGRVLAFLILLGVVLAVAGAIRPMAIVLLAAFGVAQLTLGGDPEGKVPLEGIRFALRKGWFCFLLVFIAYSLTGTIISRTIYDTILEKPASGLSASGYNLMVGVNVASVGHWNEEDSKFFEDAYDQTGDADAAHRECMQVAIQRITNEPENVLNLLVFKFRDLWQTDDFGIDWNLQWKEEQGTLTAEMRSMFETIRPFGRLFYMAILFGSLMCALSAWRGKRAPHPMFMICVLFYLGTALAHMLLETQVRYHYNMLPFLILMAVMGVVQWRRRLAIEPAVRVIYQPVEKNEEVKDDHTHFDMRQALIDGNIIMTVTEAYQAMEEATPAESGASTEAAAAGDGDSAEPSAAAENPPAASADDESGAVEDRASGEENALEAGTAEERVAEAVDAVAAPEAEPVEAAVGEESASTGDVEDENAADGAEAEIIPEAEPAFEEMDAPTIETTVNSIPDEAEAMAVSEAEPISEAESTSSIDAVEESIESATEVVFEAEPIDEEESTSAIDAVEESIESATEVVSEAEPIDEEERIPQVVTEEESVANESEVESVSEAPSIFEAANVLAIDVEKESAESDTEAVSEAELIDEGECVAQIGVEEESVANAPEVEPVSEVSSILESKNMPAIGPVEEQVEGGVEVKAVSETESSSEADAAKVDVANDAAIQNVSIAKPAYRGKHASKAVVVPESVTNSADAEAVPKAKPRGRHASKAVVAPESATNSAKATSEAKALAKTEPTREEEVPAIPTAVANVNDNAEAVPGMEAVSGTEPASEAEAFTIQAEKANVADKAGEGTVSEVETVSAAEPISEEETPAIEATEANAARDAETEAVPGPEPVHEEEAPVMEIAEASSAPDDAEAVEDSAARGVETESIPEAEPTSESESEPTIEINGESIADDAEVTIRIISNVAPAVRMERAPENDASADDNVEAEAQTIDGDKNSKKVAWSRRTSQRGMPARMMANLKSRRQKNGTGTH